MRRCSLSAAVLLALVAGPLSGCASTGSGGYAASRAHKFEAQYDVARLAESDNQYDKAQQIYEGIYKKDSANVEVCHRLGIVQARQSNFEAAKRYLNEAHRLKPSDPEILNDLGYVCFLTNDLPAAEDALQDAMKLDPGNHRATNNLALVVGTQGRMDESYRLFRQVNKEAEAHANIAYLHAQQGEGQLAMQHYSRALSLDPQMKIAANAMVEISRMQQKMEFDRTQLARAAQPTPAVQQVAAATPVANVMPQLGQVIADSQAAERRPDAVAVREPVAAARQPVAEARIATINSADNPFSDDELTKEEATSELATASATVANAPVVAPVVRSQEPAKVAGAVNARGALAVDYAALCPQAGDQIKSLLVVMNSNDPSQMKPALHKLGELGEQGAAAEPAVRAALTHADIYVRIHSALALWRIKQNTVETVPVFVAGLQHSDAGVRSFAATALAMGPQDDMVIAPLTAALSDSNAYVRMHAAETLYQYQGQEEVATEVIVAQLRDKEANVRWLATFILGEILPESDLAVKSLTGALQDQDQRIRAGAAFALGGLGQQAKPALPELKKLITDNQPEVRKAAEEAVRDIEQSSAHASAK